MAIVIPEASAAEHLRRDGRLSANPDALLPVSRHPGVNNGLSPHPPTPPEARRFLPHLDDDLAFGTSVFDVGHGLFDRFEWKDSIHNWAYDPGFYERSDLA